MTRILVFFLFAASAFPCGSERQDVKTLHDKDILRINTVVVEKTIAELNAFAAPSRASLIAAENYRFAPYELQIYKVTGYLVGFKKETDEDFHIVIRDLVDKTKTMVVEIPSEHCMKTSGALQLSWEARFGKATEKFKRARKKLKIEIIGYGFFDVIHGQTGVSKNGFELHPMIKWKEIFPNEPSKTSIRSYWPAIHPPACFA